VVKVYNDIIRAADMGKVTALVLLDLSAAFDTVDHEHLLTVLAQRFAITGTALDWFHDYLSDRSYTVQTSSSNSPVIPVSCGVPQGSVLGPVLFIAYTEDVENICKNNDIDHHLYADDKQLYNATHPGEFRTALDRLSHCVSEICSWCASRRLQLNASKTELAFFGTPASLKKLSTVDCSFNACGTIIPPSTVVRDLGVLLDSQLSLKQHINDVARICYFHLRRFRKVLRYVGRELGQQLISAFILTKLDYCNSVLAGLPKTSIAVLQHVQNAAARTLLSLHPCCPIKAALQQLHWLPVEHRIQFKLCCMMHQAHTGHAPEYIKLLLQSCAKHNTRSELRSTYTANYKLPRLHLKLGERAFSYAGPKAWNGLPTGLQQIHDTVSFKRNLKTHMFSLAFPI
jgi:hypothetical protein